MAKRWVLRQCDDELAVRLSERLRISPITARVLIHRGLRTADTARAFLQPELNHLAEPDLLPDIHAAVSRIHQAIATRQKILVYGDYDVDGITATALLLHFFRTIKVDADYYIPHRVEEGYGLNLEAIGEIQRRGVDLLITVDCGITACAEIAAARAAGIDVIVTDHHEPGLELPPACAVVNPKLTGSQYPFRELSGVGVVFKLAWSLAKRLSPGDRVSPELRQFLLDGITLVALGTVADVVPLLGENRVFVKYGLKTLASPRSPGLKALLAVSGLDGKPIEAENIAFGLAPRLNAAGRLSQAQIAVELLTTDSASRARELAEDLEKHNRDRQRVQTEILLSARERLNADRQLAGEPAIVLASEDWHPGVVGIVAARIAEDYHRPTVLIALDGDKGKGSARSIPGFHLYNAMQQCAKCLLSYGGHAGAAGLRIERVRIPEFRKQFLETAARQLRAEYLEPSISYDADVLLCTLSQKVVEELACLAPFGECNPQPVFAASRLAVAGRPRLMGARSQHLSFIVRQGDSSLRAVGFGMGALYDQVLASRQSCDLAFAPRINRFNGNETVELEIRDARWTAPAQQDAPCLPNRASPR